jgi:hypothetical protein
LHEGVKGTDVCAHIKNLEVRATFEKEHNDAQKLRSREVKLVLVAILTWLLAMSQGLSMKQERGGRYNLKKKYQNLQLQVKIIDC